VGELNEWFCIGYDINSILVLTGDFIFGSFV